MLQSNQPYQRVDDGIGAGLIGGAALGFAANTVGSGAAVMKGLKDTGSTFGELSERASKRTDRLVDRKGIKPSTAAYHSVNSELNSTMAGMKDGKAKKVANTLYGSGKRRLMSQGASIIGAGILGAGIDGANN